LSYPDELLLFASEENIAQLDRALAVLRQRHVLARFEASLWQAYPEYAVPALTDLRGGLSAVRECRPLSWGEYSSIGGVHEILSDCINATRAMIERRKTTAATRDMIEQRLLRPLTDVLGSYPYKQLYDVDENELDKLAWPKDRVRNWSLAHRERLVSIRTARQGFVL
jgi:hypothetical protein